MSQYFSFDERLGLLSVRVLDNSNVSQGSGFLYIYDNKTAYVLTAAHVVQSVEESFTIEFQPDLDDMDPKRDEDYRIRVNQTAVRYACDGGINPGEKRVDDVAVIELNIEGYPRIQERDRAEFAPEKRRWTGKNVIGNGYPRFKNEYWIEEASVTAEANTSRCQKHLSTKHYVEWHLGIDVRDPDSGDETHGWSGGVMVLADREPFIMVGFVLTMPKEYKGGETYGADMYHARRILETEFGITVREARFPKTRRRKKTSVRSSCGFCPSPQRTRSWIYGSRDELIGRLKDIITPNNPMYLYGPAGWGKSELARAIAASHKRGGKSYTIKYCLSEFRDDHGGEDHMMNSILTAKCDDKPFLGGTRKEREAEFESRLKKLGKYAKQEPIWLIIDDFYHPHLPVDMLRGEVSFQRLLDLDLFLICTTRYDLDEDEQYRIRYLFDDEGKHKHALRDLMHRRSKKAEITEAQFEEFFMLTNGNLLLADWVAKTLVDRGVQMSEVLYALRTGDFSKASFEVISDERSKQDTTLKEHILRLYDWDCLLPGEKNMLALLQFADTEGISIDMFRKQLGTEQSRCLYNLVRCGWCRLDGNRHKLDHILKLACRCKGLVPDREELNELLLKMRDFYKTPESAAHREMIRVYYTAVSAYHDDEAQLWYKETCCEQQKKGGETHD